MRAEAEAFDRFRTIRRLPQFEAGLAAAKLEAEGVRCIIADQNISAAHPLLFGEVRLQVAEADIERAEHILSNVRVRVADDEDDEHEDEGEAGAERPRKERGAEDDGYVEEAYRCPQCRRKDVDLLPLSPAMRNTRFGCLLVLAMPLILAAATWLMPSSTRGGTAVPDSVSVAWLVTVVVLAFIVLTAKRSKRCRGCGHEWGASSD
jgi:hypothetical protein